jgi:signal transduction histidine kinase
MTGASLKQDRYGMVGGASAEGSVRTAATVPPLPVPDVSDQAGMALDDRAIRTHPWVSSQFWMLQFIVLALYLIRLAATVAFHLDTGAVALEFSTFVLFLVPVLYAALNYGFEGAMLTSGWVTILAVPRFAVAVTDHDVQAAWAELAQVILLDAMALLIGQRVSSERDARTLAESSREAHLQAEALYRNLFDSNQAPILIVDGSGFVVEANASALLIFRHEQPEDGRQWRNSGGATRLVDMIGPEAAGEVLTRLISAQLPSAQSDGDPGSAGSGRLDPVSLEVDGQRALFRPSATVLDNADGGLRMQVVFEDVTAETRRRDLMEAYAARVVLGQEEERRHLAQELHDGPVQTLIHLCRQIDRIEQRSGADPTAAAPLAELRRIAEGTVSELRSIAKGLRPSILDDLGLVASINQMLADAGERQQFETSFGVTGAARRLSPSVELALFRIAQEAISNIERHARASRVAVGLDFESVGLRLLVKDDGVGFEIPTTANEGASSSLGLPGMTERAHLIGSKLTIRSEVGAGTIIDVWVPAAHFDRN